jgi:hypothetical protein
VFKLFRRGNAAKEQPKMSDESKLYMRQDLDLMYLSAAVDELQQDLTARREVIMHSLADGVPVLDAARALVELNALLAVLPELRAKAAQLTREAKEARRRADQRPGTPAGRVAAGLPAFPGIGELH